MAQAAAICTKIGQCHVCRGGQGGPARPGSVTSTLARWPSRHGCIFCLLSYFIRFPTSYFKKKISSPRLSYAKFRNIHPCCLGSHEKNTSWPHLLQCHEECNIRAALTQISNERQRNCDCVDIARAAAGDGHDRATRVTGSGDCRPGTGAGPGHWTLL